MMHDPLVAYHALIRRSIPSGMPNVQYQQPNAHQMFYQALQSRMKTNMPRQNNPAHSMPVVSGVAGGPPPKRPLGHNVLLRRNTILHPGG